MSSISPIQPYSPVPKLDTLDKSQVMTLMWNPLPKPDPRTKSSNELSQNAIPFKIPKSEPFKPQSPQAPNRTTPGQFNSKVQPYKEISLAQLQSINRNIEIGAGKRFVVNDKLKDMFKDTGYTVGDSKSDALVTTKVVKLGGGFTLPASSKISNSNDLLTPVRGGGRYDLAVPENLTFTTPNGNLIKFDAVQDRKTGAPLTKVTLFDEKSQTSKTLDFSGAPIFNPKTGDLSIARNGKQPIIFNSLLDCLLNVGDTKRTTDPQASKFEVQKFFTRLK